MDGAGARPGTAPPASPEPRPEVCFADFDVHGLVGEGEFGKVMMATKIDTQRLYAMKVLRKEQLLSRGNITVSQAITEKQVLQQMASRPHPYVVSLRFSFQTDDNIYLVMDLVGGGDLLVALVIGLWPAAAAICTAA